MLSMNTVLQKIFSEKALTVANASRMSGIPYVTISQHLKGQRRISPELAILYEQMLGISRSILRPDLWPPTASPTTESEQGEVQDA